MPNNSSNENINLCDPDDVSFHNFLNDILHEKNTPLAKTPKLLDSPLSIDLVSLSMSLFGLLLSVSMINFVFQNSQNKIEHSENLILAIAHKYSIYDFSYIPSIMEKYDFILPSFLTIFCLSILILLVKIYYSYKKNFYDTKIAAIQNFERESQKLNHSPVNLFYLFRINQQIHNFDYAWKVIKYGIEQRNPDKDINQIFFQLSSNYDKNLYKIEKSLNNLSEIFIKYADCSLNTHH